MTFRKAWLMGCSLNDMPMVCFQEKGEDFETMSTTCFKDESIALLEIDLFENKEIYQALAER